MVFEFLRNNALDANNFFTNAAGQPRAPFHQNQFGAAAGGPVVIPKFYNGRNRTFFFADYQGTRQNTSAGSSITDVPPAALRSGDFSSVKTAIYDPGDAACRTHRAGDRRSVSGQLIPQNRLNASVDWRSPAWSRCRTSARAGALARNYFYQPAQFLEYGSRRHSRRSNVSANNNFYARFSISENSKPAVGSFPGFIGGGTSSIDDARRACCPTSTFSPPTLVNEFRFGYVRHNGSIYGSGQDGAAFAQEHNVALFPAPILGFPSIAFNYSGQLSGTSEFSGWGGGDPEPQRREPLSMGR